LKIGKVNGLNILKGLQMILIGDSAKGEIRFLPLWKNIHFEKITSEIDSETFVPKELSPARRFFPSRPLQPQLQREMPDGSEG
jgi:hypothetical protein